MARLYDEYIKKIKPNLMKELDLKNIFSVPELKKIVINMGLGIDASDKKKIGSSYWRFKKNFWAKANYYENKKSNSKF